MGSAVGDHLSRRGRERPSAESRLQRVNQYHQTERVKALQKLEQKRAKNSNNLGDARFKPVSKEEKSRVQPLSSCRQPRSRAVLIHLLGHRSTTPATSRRQQELPPPRLAESEDGSGTVGIEIGRASL